MKKLRFQYECYQYSIFSSLCTAYRFFALKLFRTVDSLEKNNTKSIYNVHGFLRTIGAKTLLIAPLHSVIDHSLIPLSSGVGKISHNHAIQPENCMEVVVHESITTAYDCDPQAREDWRPRVSWRTGGRLAPGRFLRAGAGLDYANASPFRRVFVKGMGLVPGEYRCRFRVAH